MKLKYTAVIEVDTTKLKDATDYPDVSDKDTKFITQLVETEFGWVAQSGIYIKKLKPIK